MGSSCIARHTHTILKYDSSIVQGSVLLEGIPEAVQDVVLMLVPSEQTIGEAARSRHSSSVTPTVLIGVLDIGLDLVRVAPWRNLPGEYYCRAHILAVLNCLWPLPTMEDWMALKPVLLEQIQIVLRRQVVCDALRRC